MKVFLALGSNIGEREDYIKKAIDEIERRAGSIIDRSPIMQTKAYGFEDQPDFLNMALKIETELEPLELLDVLQKIELDLDRVRTVHWGPRTIDIDIIYYEDRIIDCDRLKVPHPDRCNRTFVIVPITEIEKDFVDPVENKTVYQLLSELVAKEQKDL